MLVFECPSCKTKLQAAPEHAGKAIVCPTCGTNATIPSSGITAEPVAVAPVASTAVTTPEQARRSQPAADDSRPRDRAEQATASKGMSGGVIAVIVAGLGLCGCCGVAGVVGLMLPAVQKVRESAARQETMNNMKQIALAFHNHHGAMAQFPSPKIRQFQPGARQAELSWRITILPFVEQENIWQRLNKDADWDHPENRPFLSPMPKIYMHLQRQDANKVQQDTHFQVFTGPNTPYPQWNTAPRMADFRDGTSNTFLIAEAQTPVPWLKPADMVVVPNAALPLPPEQFLAAMADGSVRIVDRRRVSDGVLRLLIDPQDGQALPPEAFD